MEVKTINPVLVNPADTNINGYSLSNSNNPDLMGQSQNVDAGSVIVKGTNPVFVGDRKISSNEFLYSEQVELNGEVLTPMDEFLYSNLTSEERKARRQGRKAQRKTTTTVAEIQANLQDIPGGPSKIEQEAKLKEGKFWNSVKGGWDNFTKSSSGQILIDSLTNYLSAKLGGPYNQQYLDPITNDAGNDPNKTPDQPMSKTTKTLLIVGGVAVVGFILYSVLKKAE
jgi:hypothetical protein